MIRSGFLTFLSMTGVDAAGKRLYCLFSYWKLYLIRQYPKKVMPLLIYATEYKSQLSSKQIELLVDKLPPAIQVKALRYRRWQDTYGCIFGKYLLHIALKKMGFSEDLSKMRYSPEHKPFLPGGPHFNISHSANRVVCIVSSEKRVGIDIENRVDHVIFDDFRPQFTQSEWCEIQSANDPKEEFYRIWTAKESVIKADGRGLGIPLDQIDVSRLQPVFLDGNVWELTRLFQFEGYACHICVECFCPATGPVLSENTASDIADLEFYEVLPSDVLGHLFT